LWSTSDACLFTQHSSQQEQMTLKTTPKLTSRKAKRFFTAAKSFFGSFAPAFSNLKKDKYFSEQIVHNLLI